jgi:hypothetical protein
VVTNSTPVIVSNVPYLPIAAGGGGCSDANGASSYAAAAAALAGKGSLTLAALSVDGNKSRAEAFFLRFTPDQWNSFLPQLGAASFGSCVTSIQVGNGGGGGASVPPSTQLDAGSTISLTPPTGPVLSLQSVLTGVYLANLTSLSSGTYMVAGAGGKDIGAFSASFNGPPQGFAWTNQNVTTITRSQGYKITWIGGDANSWVDITGGAAATSMNGMPSNVSANFECEVPATAGSFTIPASILLAMPATGGSLAVDLNANVQTMTVPNADVGIILTNAMSIQGPNVAWK